MPEGLTHIDLFSGILSEVLLWLQIGLAFGLYVSVKKKSSVRKSCKRGSGQLLPTPKADDVSHRTKRYKQGGTPLSVALNEYPSSQKSETSMERNGEEQLFLPGVSPASLSPLPDSEEARRMTVTSGQKCSVLLKKQSPIGYLQRMCLESSAWHSTRCLLIWKAKVTPQGRLLFQLVASTPRTEGIEPGLLATPNLFDYNTVAESQKKYPDGKGHLKTQIAMLPTPNAWDGRRGPGIELNMKSKSQKDRTLETVIQRGLIPTPQGSSGGPSKDSDNPRGMQAGKPLETLGKKTGMKLQPAFVEWMMGFPLGFTAIESKDSKHLETQSFPR